MAARPRATAQRPRPVGVVDIGSNSVRLVVFDGATRAPVPLFNDKVLCGLGRGLQRTGRLDPEAAASARANIERFAKLAEAMGVKDVVYVATAAVRDANDGAEFVRDITARIGRPIRVISGAEEARLSAFGVVAGIPDADGIAGDLGGGSLELVRVGRGRVGAHATMPLGPLRLGDLGDRATIKERIDESIGALDWLVDARGKNFYAVGGAWRALARVHMAHVHYPLHVIHHYAIARRQAQEFCEFIAGLSRESLERVAEVSRKRIDALPIAALVMARILKRAKPKRVVLAATGLREGCIYDTLTPAERRRDPLIEACKSLGRANARYAIDGSALMAWIAPIFRRAPESEARLRLAACLLSDIAWREHPDYRGELAFLRTLRMPVTGIDHPGRAFIAIALLARYEGGIDDPIARPAALLLDEEARARAVALGLGLRLAFSLSAGAPRILAMLRLESAAGIVRLSGPKHAAALIGDAGRRRLESFAAALGRRAVISLDR
jgi:exopolyphosphatase/guanosine-5'-triphosphate,3'-diphosphate pyrophosphatase